MCTYINISFIIEIQVTHNVCTVIDCWCNVSEKQSKKSQIPCIACFRSLSCNPIMPTRCYVVFTLLRKQACALTPRNKSMTRKVRFSTLVTWLNVPDSEQRFISTRVWQGRQHWFETIYLGINLSEAEKQSRECLRRAPEYGSVDSSDLLWR